MKTILHLCADTGSDTWPYHLDPKYEVIKIGASIGVENYTVDREIHGIYANPVCTEFSAARYGNTFGGNERVAANPESALWMVEECKRIIAEARPVWHVIENPATGTLKNYLGTPDATYEPWHFGSPWTKKTGLWGDFNMPERLFTHFSQLELNPNIYVRPGRKPSMVWLHKNAFYSIPEFVNSGMPAPQTDAEMRSLCSQGYANAFKAVNP